MNTDPYIETIAELDNIKLRTVIAELLETIEYYEDPDNNNACTELHPDARKLPSMSGGLYMTGARAKKMLNKYGHYKVIKEDIET